MDYRLLKRNNNKYLNSLLIRLKPNNKNFKILNQLKIKIKLITNISKQN